MQDSDNVYVYPVIVFLSDATNVSEAAGSETAGAQELSRYLAHNRLAPSWLDCDVPYSPLIGHFFGIKTVVHQQVAHEIPTQRGQRFFAMTAYKQAKLGHFLSIDLLLFCAVSYQKC